MTNSEGIYQALLKAPGDLSLMLMLADALEEEDSLPLSRAFRWAAEREKWPFVRRSGKGVPRRKGVYDWDWVGRTENKLSNSNRLPDDVFRAIKELPDRVYGDVMAAFVLLARALEAMGHRGAATSSLS